MKNQVNLIGNLGADPEVRYTGNGTPVCNMRIATNEFWNNTQGQRQERTEWHRIVVWGKNAENCGKFLSKGRLVSIEGKIRTRKWEDRDSNTRYTTEIIAHNVIFLGGKKNAQVEGTQTVDESQVPNAEIAPALTEEANQVFDHVPTAESDDIPF